MQNSLQTALKSFKPAVKNANNRNYRQLNVKNKVTLNYLTLEATDVNATMAVSAEFKRINLQSLIVV